MVPQKSSVNGHRQSPLADSHVEVQGTLHHQGMD